jgi:hypothetical protein
MKRSDELLAILKEVSKRLENLATNPATHDLDADAVVDLNLARQSVDKLINRVERLVG